MKNFHRNLLVLLAAALCALCVYQWHDQIVQRQSINALNQLVYTRDADIQKYTNSLATLDRQVAQFDVQLTEYKNTVQTNAELIATQKRELTRLQFITADLTNQVAQYKQAVDTLEARLKEAAAGIEKQNTAIKDLAAQRDDLVTKYNAEVKDRNDVVTKYNALVDQIKKAQAAQDKNAGSN